MCFSSSNVKCASQLQNDKSGKIRQHLVSGGLLQVSNKICTILGLLQPWENHLRSRYVLQEQE